MSETQTNVAVIMTSDYICPWCWIGEKRLLDAISDLPGNITVEIQLKPFELNPEMPAEGMDRDVYRSLKFGSLERSQQLDAGTVAAGAPDGVLFDYEAIQRTPNTFAAHKLTQWAKLQGSESEISHRIMRAYFVEGRDIGDITTLTEIADEAGLSADAARGYLEDPETTADTQEALAQTIIAGARSVPQFDIEGTKIRGAQAVDTLKTAILTAARAKACANSVPVGG